MKLNKKEETRTLHAHASSDGRGYVLIERERYQDTYGTGRNKWAESRVYISHEELERLSSRDHAAETLARIPTAPSGS